VPKTDVECGSLLPLFAARACPSVLLHPPKKALLLWTVIPLALRQEGSEVSRPLLLREAPGHAERNLSSMYARLDVRDKILVPAPNALEKEKP